MNQNDRLGQSPTFSAATPESYELGMSQRLYIATAIAQGLCGNSNYGVNTNNSSEFAKICYKLTDELLKQEHE